MVVLLVGTVLKGVLVIANNVLVARLANLATFDLRKLFYRRTLRLDLATFNDEGSSDLMSRFTHDMSNVGNGLETVFGKLIRRAAEDDRLPGGGGLGLLAAVAALAGRRPRWPRWPSAG